MLFLNVWGSDDPFSHEMRFLCSMNSGDDGDAEIKKYYERHVAQFNNKTFSCLSAMLVDIDCVTNQVTTVGNFRQAHPLKEKKIINPSVVEVRKARLAKKQVLPKAPQLGGNTFIWDEAAFTATMVVAPQQTGF